MSINKKHCITSVNQSYLCSLINILKILSNWLLHSSEISIKNHSYFHLFALQIIDFLAQLHLNRKLFEREP